MAKFNKFTPEAFRDNEVNVKNLADSIRDEHFKSSGKTISDIAKLKLGELKRSRAKLTVNTEKEGFQLRLRESDNPAQTGEEIHALRKGAQLTIVSDEVINRPDASGLPA